VPTSVPRGKGLHITIMAQIKDEVEVVFQRACGDMIRSLGAGRGSSMLTPGSKVKLSSDL
jgi:hypothetical protein